MFPAFNLAEFTANLSKRINVKASPPHQPQMPEQKAFNLSSVKSEDRSIDPAESIAALIGLNSAIAGVQLAPPPAAAAPQVVEQPVQKEEKSSMFSSLELIQNLEHELTNNVNNNFEMNQQLNNGDMNDREDDSHFDYSGPVLTDNCISFDIQVPNLLPNYLSMHYVCETGSRLLFSTVMWVKKNCLFQMLR
jgi:nuclear receptor subfamily 2 group C